ncbi:MAG TPA: HAMP domain-containing sensor histidine kinase [Pyrinomonadaceae bacterium]|nr:HAMP domain-containing sensor histidine kinase [Pyrinomonadaceae bacterium]
MRRRRTAIFFLVLGILLSAIAFALNVGWILLNLREVVLMVLGALLFSVIITGLILNTIFLVREIKLNEQKDAFLSMVTHELKSPLAAIKLYLDTLQERDLEAQKRQEFYKAMADECERLRRNVDQLLTASRPAADKKAADFNEHDLAEILESAIGQTAKRFDLEDRAIRLIRGSQSAKVLCDREELETAFLNLLDNAVKYTPEEKKITVRLRATQLSGKLEVFIRDNGIGLTDAELRRIFRRFYRAAKDKSVKGTGLGLFIVKNIITRHGGTIRAESRGIGRGTTFIVRLPSSK